MFIKNYLKFILFHIPSSKIHVFQYFFLSLSPLFVGIHMWQWLLDRILQLPLEHWSGHNVNSQFTFTPSTGSDQKIGQKHQKVSIMYDTPHKIVYLSFLVATATNQICGHFGLIELWPDEFVASEFMANLRYLDFFK